MQLSQGQVRRKAQLPTMYCTQPMVHIHAKDAGIGPEAQKPWNNIIEVPQELRNVTAHEQ